MFWVSVKNRFFIQEILGGKKEINLLESSCIAMSTVNKNKNSLKPKQM